MKTSLFAGKENQCRTLVNTAELCKVERHEENSSDTNSDICSCTASSKTIKIIENLVVDL